MVMLKVMDAKDALMEVKLRALVTGLPGSGKTYFASSAPKVYYMGFSLGEGDTFKVQPQLRQNIVKVAELVPGNDEELKQLFGDLDKGVENGLIHKCIAEAKQLYTEGKVETLVLDTLTYLVDYLWLYLNKFCPKYTRNNELDTRGMYGELNTRLSRLVGLQIMSFPANLIATTHEMLENEEAMEKKIDQSSPVVANILGGFRNKIEGMFSLNMYLAKVEKGGQYSYWARTNKGNMRNGKTRNPLPPTIQDISYTKIMQVINEAIKTNETTKVGEVK
jgi:hypothetical protein